MGSSKEAEKAVLKFFRSAHKCGLTREMLTKIDPDILNNVGNIPVSFTTMIYKWIKKLIVFIISLFLLGILLLTMIFFASNWNYTSESLEKVYTSLSKAYFAYYDLDPVTSPCLIESFNDYEFYNDLTRKPWNCNFCANIKGAKRLEKLTEDEFVSYVKKNYPIVVTDAMNNWTARSEFSFQYFKKLYTEIVPKAEFSKTNDDCQFFPYRNEEFDTLDDFFEMSDERAQLLNVSDPWYIGWSNCWPTATRHLRYHYNRPYFLPKISESTRFDWIFMGAPGYGAHMHVDNVRNPSWQAQISGIKIWKLMPPLECLSSCNSFDVEVKPGEIIVLDTNTWYHATLIMGDEMSISIGSEFD